jgi:hypothetical protein
MCRTLDRNALQTIHEEAKWQKYVKHISKKHLMGATLVIT